MWGDCLGGYSDPGWKGGLLSGGWGVESQGVGRVCKDGGTVAFAYSSGSVCNPGFRNSAESLEIGIQGQNEAMVGGMRVLEGPEGGWSRPLHRKREEPEE